MTEGGLATWKVKEGDRFAAGDVLLEIETDKATMDVEAQEDGIMAKIVVDAGAKGVPVGKTIAMLGEEGDDFSNVEVPAEESAPAQGSSGSGGQTAQAQASSSSSSSPSSLSQADPTPSEQNTPAGSPPKAAGHAPDLGQHLFPSVSRLLAENHVSAEDAKRIKGTGLHGMITKGDVLAFLGKASSPTGSYKVPRGGIAALGGAPSSAGAGGKAKEASEPLTADAVRSMILAGLAASSHATRAKALASKPVTNAAAPATAARRSAFDELLDDYEFGPTTSKKASPSSGKKDSHSGLL